MTWVSRNIGAQIGMEALALIPQVITAGAGDDGVEVDGDGVDRFGDGTIDLPTLHPEDGAPPHLSCALVLGWQATLGAADTLTLAANLQDDTELAFGDTPADIGSATEDQLVAVVVATGGSGGTIENGATKLNVDLSSERRFIRAQVTATLSAGATDTVALGGVFVFGGGYELPWGAPLGR